MAILLKKILLTKPSWLSRSLDRCGIFFQFGFPSSEQPFLRINRLDTIQRMKTFVTAIGQQSSRLNIIPKSDGKNVIDEGVSPLRMKHGKEKFDPAIEISGHKIRTTQEHFVLSCIVKVIDPGMFQETTDDRAHRDGLTHS